MRFSDLLGTSLGNLSRHKLRTTLTVAGVTIGTTLLALMVSIAAGLQAFVLEQTTAIMPDDLITVTSYPDVGSIRLNFGQVGAPAEEIKEDENKNASAEPISSEQIVRMRDVPHVESVFPIVSFRADSIGLTNSSREFQVSASAAYPGSRIPLLVAGAGFTGSVEEVILANQYLTVFGWPTPDDAIGKMVVLTVSRQVPPASGQRISAGTTPRVEKEQYRAKIVGITAKTAEGTSALVPYDYALEMARWQRRDRRAYSADNFGFTGYVKVDSAENVDAVAASLRQLKLAALTPADQLGMINTIYGYLQGVLSVFGLIALAVASLGISNTLVMAIYERTREIGVWKALGATRGTIMALFTMEAATIGVIGGAAGVAIAWVFGQGINAIARATFARDFSSFALSAFPLWLVALVVGIGGVVGLAAGLLPANRAAGLDPVAALRHE